MLGAEVSISCLFRRGWFFLTLAGQQTELHSVWILTRGRVRLCFEIDGWQVEKGMRKRRVSREPSFYGEGIKRSWTMFIITIYDRLQAKKREWNLIPDIPSTYVRMYVSRVLICFVLEIFVLETSYVHTHFLCLYLQLVEYLASCLCFFFNWGSCKLTFFDIKN